jgi:hypothetical protein
MRQPDIVERLEHPLLLFLPAADALDGDRLAEL